MIFLYPFDHCTQGSHVKSPLALISLGDFAILAYLLYKDVCKDWAYHNKNKHSSKNPSNHIDNDPSPIAQPTRKQNSRDSHGARNGRRQERNAHAFPLDATIPARAAIMPATRIDSILWNISNRMKLKTA